eukprot:7712428-Pyramimonas_sp.AAC.1
METKVPSEIDSPISGHSTVTTLVAPTNVETDSETFASSHKKVVPVKTNSCGLGNARQQRARGGLHQPIGRKRI